MQRLRFANVEILPDERRVLVAGAQMALGARAFDLLMCLVEHRDRVVGKDELLQRVWPDLVVEESNLTVHVAALRKCLGPQAIATVSGRGYRFTAELTVADIGPPPATTSVVEPAAPVAPSVVAPPPDKPSLAVMPFANLSGDETQDYFVDGIVDDITTALSRVRAFFVIARSSSLTYKGRVVDAPQVGRDLGVRYLVEGSLRQAGERLRIGVQLVETRAGRLVWSERFEGLRGDIFELQDRIAAQVSAAIEPSLVRAELEFSRSKPTNNLQAYDLCLRALPRLHLPASRREFEDTVSLLEQAIAMDPGYSHAKALYCWAHVTAAAARRIDPQEARRALPLAMEVLADHREDPTSLAYAGHAAAYLGRLHEEGLRALDRALALNPSSVPALCSSGWVRLYVGDAAVALDNLQRAVRLNPLAPQQGHGLSGLGYALLMAGRLDEALSTLRQAYVEAPLFATTLIGLTHCLWKMGRGEEAREAAARLLSLAPNMRISAYRTTTPFVSSPFVDEKMSMLEAAGIPA